MACNLVIAQTHVNSNFENDYAMDFNKSLEKE